MTNKQQQQQTTCNLNKQLTGDKVYSTSVNKINSIVSISSSVTVLTSKIPLPSSKLLLLWSAAVLGVVLAVLLSGGLLLSLFELLRLIWAVASVLSLLLILVLLELIPLLLSFV